MIVCVHVIVWPGVTAVGPAFTIPRSTLAVPVHAAPSLLALAAGPTNVPTSEKVGAGPPGLATATSKMVPLPLLEKPRFPLPNVHAAP